MHGTLNVRHTYKTPKALGFSKCEFDALAWFVDQYDAGVVTDLENEAVVESSEVVKVYGPLDRFYMPATVMATNCGTAGCILGWLQHRIPNFLYHNWPDPIFDLFYHSPDGTKAADARDATVRVLRGEPTWPR